MTTVDTNYTFTGREDDGNGLLYYRNRYYSSTMKRFISEDPIGLNGGINQYAYVMGNPLSFNDPYGEWAWGDPLPAGFEDYSAGIGDTLTFGLTKYARNALNIGRGGCPKNNYYQFGEDVGIALSIIAGGEFGWIKGGIKKSGMEFSHWIPSRYFRPLTASGKNINPEYKPWLDKIWGWASDTKLNGNYVSPYEHYLYDPLSFPEGWRSFPDRPSQLLQQINRVPYIYLGGVMGGTSGTIYKETQ